MGKITIDVDEGTHKAIKKKAIDEGKTMHELIIELLKAGVSENE